jgi:hypothetical protein
MKRLLTLAVAVAAVASSLSAQAAVLDVNFSGLVQSQTGTAFAVNSPISGEFMYDTSTNWYTSFMIGGYSSPINPDPELGKASGYESKAYITPDQYSAQYTAQLSPVSPVPLGGTINNTFWVDLEGMNQWPTFDAVALLTNSSQLPSNLDTTLSNFGFYTANADGTNIQQLTASITRFAVPEPTSFGLLLVGAAAMFSQRLTRRTRC